MPSETIFRRRKIRRRKQPLKVVEEDDRNFSSKLELEEVDVLQSDRRKRFGLEASMEKRNSKKVRESQNEIMMKTFGLKAPKQTEDPYLEDFIAKRLRLNKKHKTLDTPQLEVPAALLEVSDSFCREPSEKMNWVTGIQEVEMTLDAQAENVATTEKAKLDFIQKKLTKK